MASLRCWKVMRFFIIYGTITTRQTCRCTLWLRLKYNLYLHLEEVLGNVCVCVYAYLLHPLNHEDNSCHIHTRNGLKSYKWRPIRLTHMIYHHPSVLSRMQVRFTPAAAIRATSGDPVSFSGMRETFKSQQCVEIKKPPPPALPPSLC